MEIELNTKIEDDNGDTTDASLNANDSNIVINYIRTFFDTYDALSQIEITIKAK